MSTCKVCRSMVEWPPGAAERCYPRHDVGCPASAGAYWLGMLGFALGWTVAWCAGYAEGEADGSNAAAWGA